MKGIISQLIQHAAGEGIDNALRTAENLQQALEEIAEMGNKDEQTMACQLLKRVNKAIVELKDGGLVEMARKHSTDTTEFFQAVIKRFFA